MIVTHKLDEVRAVADAATVLRQGETVARFTAQLVAPRVTLETPAARSESGDPGDPGIPRPAGRALGAAGESAAPYRFTPTELEITAIARAMVGGELPAPSTVAAPAADAPVALALRGLAVTGALHAIDLAVRAGELVGVAGVDGNGQRELAEAIAGLRAHTGAVVLAGRDLARSTPHQRLAAGLAHVPEDRQHGGLVLDASIADNLALGRADITGRFVIDRAAVARFADARIAELDIRPATRGALVRSLSGGNQQKVVIGRELSRPHLAAVLACQPTRGVDLGAVARIHEQLRAAASAGAGVLVISADLDELLALCHRVVVLLRGRVVGEAPAPGEGTTTALHGPGARARLGELMTGVQARGAA